MAEKKVDRQLLLTAVLGLAALVLAGVITYYQFGALKDVRAAVAEERLAVARVQAHLRDLEQTKEQAAQLEQRLKLLESMMPAAPDEDRLIAVMRDYADSSGMELQQVRFKERAAREGYHEMPVEITFEGRYNELLYLLSDLQAGQRALRIDELKVGKGRQELPELKADIIASAFYASQ